MPATIENAKLKVGQKWSRHSYGTIKRTNAAGSVEIENENGLQWTIGRKIFDEEFQVAGHVDETQEVNRTEMVETIMQYARVAMVITFNKKPEHRELVNTVKKLLALPKKSQPGPRKLSSMLREATEGEQRTMVGRHAGATDGFGRLHFTDMEIEGEHNARLVDPRTVTECIVNGIKFVLK